ncbi:MAG: hypothetical protein ABII22_03830 [Candidatus Micrarchaeota archaeon]
MEYQYYPKSDAIPVHLEKVVNVFRKNAEVISSGTNKFSSDHVLSLLKPDLEQAGFDVESGKKFLDKINIPVLYGKNGIYEKSFDVDAFQKMSGTVLEIEAGRAVTNYQFLKDFFSACVMSEVYYLVIAVRKKYRDSPDFERVLTFFDTLYASKRLSLPLKGMLIIGY